MMARAIVVCPLCGCQLRVLAGLRAHMKICHGDLVLSNKCPVCGLQFSSRATRNQHMKRLALKGDVKHGAWLYLLSLQPVRNISLRVWIRKCARKMFEVRQP